MGLDKCRCAESSKKTLAIMLKRESGGPGQRGSSAAGEK